MNTQEQFALLIARFQEAANPEQAQAMSAYLRHQFIFFGVPTPARRKLYQDILSTAKNDGKIDWDLLTLAWQAPERELDYFVCDYLVACQQHLTFDNVPTILSFASTHEWWDTIDQFDRILGNIADERITTLMLELAESDDFWMRRIAIDHQLLRKEKTDTDLLEAILLKNLGSDEFFINKAIGWSLRDYSKTNPEWVRQFIQKYKEKMAPLSIKEASKYL